VPAETFRHIGMPHPRKEDARLVTGRGRYIDDIVLPLALHACFVRSPHAHARIISINTAEALSMPGVVAVYTGRDLAQWTARQRMAPPIDGLRAMEMDTLPIDKVRFQGDPVACVIATNRYLAEDAVEFVDVNWDVLAAVTSMSQALSPDAPRVDDTLPDNLLSHQHAVHGDPDRAMATAYRVVESTFSQHRQTHLPIETRGCIADWDTGREHLNFHVGTQVPHPYRTTLAARLQLAESQVTVMSPDVGGGFGQKIALYREELTVAAASIQLGRPDGEPAGVFSSARRLLPNPCGRR
jgi:carbon-monoxide dehydrogenase large subunit